MSYTFDGASRRIILSSGVTALDVKDCYSRWKEWVATSDNSKYLPAFEVVGGNPTVGSNTISSYFFLLNGWKIRPQEASHTLEVSGILITEDNSDPFVDTIGNYRVRIVQIVPLQAETISVYSEGASDPAAIASAVWNTPLNSQNTADTFGNFVKKLLTVTKFLGLK